MKQWLIVGLVVVVLLGSYFWNRNRSPQTQGEDLPSVEEVIVKEDGQVVKKVGDVEEVLSEEAAAAMKLEIEGKVAGAEAVALTPTENGQGKGISSQTFVDGKYYHKITISEVAPAQKGYFYEAWLENPQGEQVSIGRLEMQGGEGQLLYASSDDKLSYTKFLVSYEQEDGNAAIGEIVLDGTTETVSDPETSDDTI